MMLPNPTAGALHGHGCIGSRADAMPVGGTTTLSGARESSLARNVEMSPTQDKVTCFESTRPILATQK